MHTAGRKEGTKERRKEGRNKANVTRLFVVESVCVCEVCVRVSRVMSCIPRAHYIFWTTDCMQLTLGGLFAGRNLSASRLSA